jgi:hypothetical protein
VYHYVPGVSFPVRPKKYTARPFVALPVECPVKSGFALVLAKIQNCTIKIIVQFKCSIAKYSKQFDYPISKDSVTRKK